MKINLNYIIIFVLLFGCNSKSKEFIGWNSDNTEATLRRNNVEKHIHYTPLNQLLDNMDDLDSLKQNILEENGLSQIREIELHEDRIKSDVYYYLDRSKILCFNKFRKKDYYNQYQHNLFQTFMICNKNSPIIHSFKKLDEVDCSINQKEFAHYKYRINSLFKFNTKIADRVDNYTFHPIHYRLFSIQELKLQKNLDTSLNYTFYIAKIPLQPSYNSNPHRNFDYEKDSTQNIEDGSMKKIVKDYTVTKPGLYFDRSFVIAIPKETVGYKSENRFYNMEPCVNCALPKLFLCKDMCDYEYQKKFLMELLKKRFKDEEKANKAFLLILLSPDYEAFKVENGTDQPEELRIIKRNDYYEWEYFSSKFNCKIKGTIKGTEVEGEFIINEELKTAMKKHDFPNKKKWRKFKL